MMYGYGGYGPWGGGFGLLPMLMMVVFWAAVIVGIVVLIRWVWGQTTRASTPPPAGDSPLDILKRRYARGEINREEFDEKKRDLGA